MLFASAWVVVGGVRLARLERVERIPADRVRLQEFTDAFQAEIERLAEIFQEHLADIAAEANPGNSDRARALCARIAGVRALHSFRNRDTELSVGLPSLNRSPAPAVIL
jgi:hypothetical protein